MIVLSKDTPNIKGCVFNINLKYCKEGSPGNLSLVGDGFETVIKAKATVDSWYTQ